MTTVESAIRRAQNRLRSTFKRRVTRLNGGILAGAESLVVDNTTGIGIGNLICIDAEVFYVTDKSGTTVSVIPAFAGTETDAHDDDALVEVNYAHAMTGLLVQHAIDELRAWVPDLYQVDTMTVSLASDVRSYSTGLTYGTEAFSLLRGWLAPASGDISLEWKAAPFHTLKRGPASIGADELSLLLDFVPGYAGDLHIEYAKPFDLDPFELSTDLVADVGLSASMLDLLYMGIAYRALSEIPTMDVQNQVESRTQEEVPPGQITAVREDLRREYERRRQVEIGRLQALYPPRMG